ncbi:alpha/beta fold hydrolase [Rhodococcus sp. WS4]|nr:alpha/beta fold hydrolase [Rhodococcus sp. WS4]
MKTMMLPATGTEPALEIVHAPATGVADRSPLLFVHGLGHGAWCWHNWLEAAAAAGHQAYALSFRGHGGSEGSVAGARLRDYVADTVRAATSIADGKGVFIGHSLGGLIVQHALPVIKPAAAVLLASISAHPAIGTAISVVRNETIRSRDCASSQAFPSIWAPTCSSPDWTRRQQQQPWCG